MEKRAKTLSVILLYLSLLILAACQNSEQKRVEDRAELHSFAKKVNKAIFAKDADYIIRNWNPQSPKPQRVDLEHLFRGLNAELSSSNSKYKRGFVRQTGNKIKSTSVYTTLDPHGQATTSIVVSRSGRAKCCLIEAINFDYKYKYYQYSKPAALRETNKSAIARRQFHIEFKNAIFAKNTDFILRHWSPHANPMSEDTLVFMLNTVSNEFAPSDMFSKDRPAEIYADRIVRHTKFSTKGEKGEMYINLSTSALSETECCHIESIGILSSPKSK